jgi:hypothetical protein
MTIATPNNLNNLEYLALKKKNRRSVGCLSSLRAAGTSLFSYTATGRQSHAVTQQLSIRARTQMPHLEHRGANPNAIKK